MTLTLRQFSTLRVKLCSYLPAACDSKGRNKTISTSLKYALDCVCCACLVEDVQLSRLFLKNLGKPESLDCSLPRVIGRLESDVCREGAARFLDVLSRRGRRFDNEP